MYDGGKIFIGIVIFLSVATSPFLFNMGKATARPDPKLDTPEIQKMEKKQCVEPKEFMKAEHMTLLNDWRDSVVREGNKVYIGLGGEVYNMSLQGTCMKCHSNKKKFCDECHKYVAVKPYCWDCHIPPKEN
ncbi:MAG: sulfate reduction electron transfer complex DsrMKJOP subunit DsrJ [Nitrospirae bacterium]|nr:sulfate reduction electron transfer complex DsrMKJOP subunit DsrJ [Nitrospirota bacterium]